MLTSWHATANLCRCLRCQSAPTSGADCRQQQPWGEPFVCRVPAPWHSMFLWPSSNECCGPGGRAAPLHGQHARAAGGDGGAAAAAGRPRLDRRQHPLLPVGQQPLPPRQARLPHEGNALSRAPGPHCDGQAHILALAQSMPYPPCRPLLLAACPCIWLCLTHCHVMRTAGHRRGTQAAGCAAGGSEHPPDSHLTHAVSEGRRVKPQWRQIEFPQASHRAQITAAEKLGDECNTRTCEYWPGGHQQCTVVFLNLFVDISLLAWPVIDHSERAVGCRSM